MGQLPPSFPLAFSVTCRGAGPWGGRLEPRPRRASAERGFGALVGGSGLVKQGWEPTF